MTESCGSLVSLYGAPADEPARLSGPHPADSGSLAAAFRLKFARSIAFCCWAIIPAIGPGPCSASEFRSSAIPMRSDLPILSAPLDRTHPILVQDRRRQSVLKRRDPLPPTLRPTLSSANPQGDGEIIECRATSTANDPLVGGDRALATPSTCVLSILDVIELMGKRAPKCSMSFSASDPDRTSPDRCEPWTRFRCLPRDPRSTHCGRRIRAAPRQATGIIIERSMTQ
jgi:hypothetical protein